MLLVLQGSAHLNSHYAYKSLVALNKRSQNWILEWSGLPETIASLARISTILLPSSDVDNLKCIIDNYSSKACVWIFFKICLFHNFYSYSLALIHAEAESGYRLKVYSSSLSHRTRLNWYLTEICKGQRHTYLWMRVIILDIIFKIK